MADPYALHPSPRLQQLFRERPYQGARPDSAKVLFVGKDANYSSDLTGHPFMAVIESYHQNPIAFWQSRGVHHPFLVPEYPFRKNGGGVPYHRNFAKLGLRPEHAEMISFVELLDVPTTGVTSKDEREFFALLRPKHMVRLERFILWGSAELVFIGAGVLRLLQRIADTTEAFRWLVTGPSVRENDGLVRLFTNQRLRVYKNHSFSSSHVHAQLPALRRRLTEVLPRLD